MNKKIISGLMALTLSLTLSAPAFSVASATTLDIANPESNMPIPTENMLYNKNVYSQICLSQTDVIEDGVLIGTRSEYVFTPQLSII